MAMTETKRQTEILISFPTKIVQKKRKVTALSQKPRAARAAKDLCKAHASSLLQTKALRGYSAASFLSTPWQETSVITLMIGFDTAGEGHKKFDVAVKTERSWEVGIGTP
jgi:hypothetical protein